MDRKIVSAHQPVYIPWLGYFDKLAKSNTHVILDDVEYSKNDLFNRNEIKTPQGRMWLTIPIIYKNKTPINKIKINNSTKWQSKHWKSLKSNYSKSPFFADFEYEFEKFYSEEYEYLADLTINFSLKISEILGINTQFIKSSNLNPSGNKDERLINLCKILDSNKYLTGIGAVRSYTNKELYKDHDIDLIIQKFEHPVYFQRWNEFEPQLSILDILFNMGHIHTSNLLNESKLIQYE